MNDNQKKLFEEFLSELKQKIKTEVDNGTSPESYDGKTFDLKMEKLIMEKYSDIYFYIKQFHKDLDRALEATFLSLALHDAFYIPPYEVLDELLDFHTYLDGRLIPLKCLLKTYLLNDFAKEHNVPKKVIQSIISEDESIMKTFNEKIEASYELMKKEKADKFTFYPAVEESTLREEKGNLH